MSGAFRELDGHDAYEVLGLEPDATSGDIRRAYRALARAVHPDLVTDPAAKPAAEERLRLLNAAMEVLTRRRATYDAARRAAEDGPPPGPEEEVIIDDPWDVAAPGRPSPAHDPWRAATPGRVPPPRPAPPPYARPAPPPHARPGSPPPRSAFSYMPMARRTKERLATAFAIVVSVTAVAWCATILVRDFLPDEPRAEVAVPRALAGTWKGTVDLRDPKGGSRKVELTLDAGRKVGKIRYPPKGCTGEAVPIGLRSGTLTIRPVFSGGHSRCDAGDITLTPGKKNRASIVCYDPGGKRKKATGTLRRDQPGPRP
ncbi:J domain-containing protein [Spirillospora albida]|uniref:J domain-containing protein n=1 Tax=Spirillospora albida TaxID=58123 RepID=UPI00068C04DC|nr:DnaJ domain-containing protein [Spirillospora albida]